MNRTQQLLLILIGWLLGLLARPMVWAAGESTGTRSFTLPTGSINTAPEANRTSPSVRIITAERANMGLQVTNVTNAANLSKVEYWSTTLPGSSSVKVAESTTPANYTAAWNNLRVGTYEVRGRLLNAQNAGTTTTPLNLTVVPDQFSTTSFLGAAGTDEVRAMVFQPDGTLTMAVNTTVTPAGVTPVLLNGATAASAGAILRLSANGRQVLGMTRLATQVVDMATDSQGRLYVAAGTAGAFRLNAAASTVDWLQTYTGGQYVHRIDAGPQGNAVVLTSTETNPDDTGLSSARIFRYTTTGAFSFSVGGVSEFSTDVAIDEATQTVVGVGHKDFNAPGSATATTTAPVFVPVMRGWSFTGTPKYTGYDWSNDPASPNFINRPENNMADTRASRAAIGQDGRLYVIFNTDGGNSVIRYDPFNIMQLVPIVGGDTFFQYTNAGSGNKAFIGRFNPSTGAYIAGQRLVGRSTTTNQTTTIDMQRGNVTADADGRVYLVGSTAFGAPLTVDHLPGQYIGGAFAVVLSPDLSRREVAIRVARDNGRAIAVRDPTNWAYGGSTTQPVFYPSNAAQATFGGATDGFYAVTGGAAPCTVMATTKAGSWTDPTVWTCNRLPTNTDPVTIRHVVNIPASTMANPQRVIYEAGGRIQFGSSSSLRLR